MKIIRIVFTFVVCVTCVFLGPVFSSGSTTTLSNNGFPVNFLEKIVQSPIVQRKLKSRWKWEVWDVVPGTHAYQIYIFNITNPDEFLNGAKPMLQQVGPYYYEESRVKFDVSMNLDLSVNYERNYSYTFDPARSNGDENDLVNVLNIPLLAFSSIASEVDPKKANDAVNNLIAKGEKLVSRRVRVGDVLFQGFDVTKYQPYLALFGNNSNRQDLIQEFASGRYGVFSHNNGAHEHAFVVDSGLLNDDEVGEIVTWNSMSKLQWWNGDSCNMINGTDSSTFSPYLNRSATLQVFDLDMCRSIGFTYAGDMLFRNAVKGWTFNISENTLEDPAKYDMNKCFCKTPNHCLKKGVLDTSSCRGDAPYVMSYAHFLDADAAYLQAVDGLKPNSTLHKTQIDVEPVTGAVINYRKRFQWNILLKPFPQIDAFKSIKLIIFPILWNDDVFHLNHDKAELLVEELAMQMGGMSDTASDLLKLTDATNAVCARVVNWQIAFTVPFIALFSHSLFA